MGFLLNGVSIKQFFLNSILYSICTEVLLRTVLSLHGVGGSEVTNAFSLNISPFILYFLMPYPSQFPNTRKATTLCSE